MGEMQPVSIDWKIKYASSDGLRNYLEQFPDKSAFVVPAGDLGFNVLVFMGCGIVCLLTLVARRRVFGAELGGDSGPKVATALLFVFLWLLYVILSSAVVMKWIEV